MEIPNSKHQKPRKFEIRISKFETNSKYKIQMLETKCAAVTEPSPSSPCLLVSVVPSSPFWILNFGPWDFLGFWCLEFGAFPAAPTG
jgi:hypothetical protein